MKQVSRERVGHRAQLLRCAWAGCKFCPGHSTSGRELLEHWRREHGPSYRATVHDPSAMVDCQWGNCRKRFRPGSYSTEAHIRGHLAREHGWKEFACEICRVHFTRRPDLTAHFKKKHAACGLSPPTPTLSPSPERRYSTVSCESDTESADFIAAVMSSLSSPMVTPALLDAATLSSTSSSPQMLPHSLDPTLLEARDSLQHAVAHPSTQSSVPCGHPAQSLDTMFAAATMLNGGLSTASDMYFGADVSALLATPPAEPFLVQDNLQSAEAHVAACFGYPQKQPQPQPFALDQNFGQSELCGLWQQQQQQHHLKSMAAMMAADLPQLFGMTDASPSPTLSGWHMSLASEQV